MAAAADNLALEQFNQLTHEEKAQLIGRVFQRQQRGTVLMMGALSVSILASASILANCFGVDTRVIIGIGCTAIGALL